MSRAKKEKDPNKLGFGRLMAWKSSDVSSGWVNVIMLNYLSIYASDTLGIPLLTVTTLLMASKFVDAFTDLFAGWLVDNTHTKLGKGRPYDLAIVGMTLCAIGIFLGNPAWGTTLKCIYIFCMYTFTFSIFSTLRTAANNPYTIRHFSNNPILIRKVASYGGIITMAGTMFCSILFPRLLANIADNGSGVYSESGWITTVAIFMIPATLIGLVRFFVCKEDPSVDAESSQEPVKVKEIFTMFAKNKYVWLYAIIMLSYNIITNMAVGSYYFKWVVGDMGMAGVISVVGIVLLPLMFAFPAIMKKIGSMGKMVALFSIIGVVGYIVVFLGGANLGIVLPGYVLGTFATLPLAYYGVLFIMNICSYNEMIGLPRMDGSSGIIGNFATKVGGAMGAWVTGILLSLGGYISGTNVTTQPDSAIVMIRVAFGIVPAVFLVIIGICAFAFSKLEPKAEAFEAEKKAKAEAEKAQVEAEKTEE